MKSYNSPDPYRYGINPHNHQHKFIAREHWDDKENKWFVIEACKICGYEIDTTYAKRGCPNSKDWKHDFVTRTFLCDEGTFKGQLILEMKCTRCQAKFETLFERALTVKQTI